MRYLLSQPHKGLALLLSITLFLLSTLAQAGAFVVSPVRVTLSNKQKVASLTVVNQGAEKTTIQLEALAWSQDEHGKDVLVPTKNILANPPVFTLEPNAKQVIRLGLRKPSIGINEESYRLILQEVPPPLKEGFMGLSVALRMSVPIFVMPTEPIKPAMLWQLKLGAEGLKLLGENQGLGHVQVLSLELYPQEKPPLFNKQAVSYLLPQQKREWPINNKTLSVGMPVLLKAQTDVGVLEAQLTVTE
jgi:fimbrial chaperone protein